MPLVGNGWPRKLKILDLLSADMWNANPGLDTKDVTCECPAADEKHQESVVEVCSTTKASRSLNKQARKIIGRNGGVLQTGFDPGTIHCQYDIAFRELVLVVVFGVMRRPLLYVSPAQATLDDVIAS